MNYHCFLSPLGYAILNEGEKQSLTWSKFTGAPEKIAQTYWEIVNDHDFAEALKILPAEGIVHIDNRPLFEYLEENLGDSDVQLKYRPLSFAVVEQLDTLLTPDELETSDYISKLIASITVQNQKETRDVYIAQAIASLDDLTKTINLASNRIREWYGLHFPELGEFIEEPQQLFRLIKLIGNRDTTDWPELGVSENKEARIREMAEASLGAEINIEDLKPIQDLAKLGQDLINTRSEIEEYINTTVFVIMPNVTKLIGPLVSARLLAQAGSLRNLSKMPSSTIQLLGAETALFRHLKTGENPPKHGYLFQSPLIHMAPFHQRGKIARIIAGKIAIAARLDHFTGEEQPGLVEDLNKRLEYVSTHFVKAPIREKRPESRSSGVRRPKRKFDDKDRRRSEDRSRRGYGGKSRDGDRPKRNYRDDSKKGSDRKFGGDRDKKSDRGFGGKSSDRGSDRKSKGGFDKKSDRGFDKKPRSDRRDSSKRSDRRSRDGDSKGFKGKGKKDFSKKSSERKYRKNE